MSTFARTFMLLAALLNAALCTVRFTGHAVYLDGHHALGEPDHHHPHHHHGSANRGDSYHSAEQIAGALPHAHAPETPAHVHLDGRQDSAVSGRAVARVIHPSAAIEPHGELGMTPNFRATHFVVARTPRCLGPPGKSRTLPLLI